MALRSRPALHPAILSEAMPVASLLSVGRTKGKPLSRHAKKPPASGRTLLIPFLRSSSATRALVASFGQVQ
jgi:hypothetical protein